MPQELMAHCEKHMAYLNDTSLRASHGAFAKTPTERVQKEDQNKLCNVWVTDLALPTDAP